MRCLSPHSNYSIQVFEGNEQVVVDARGYAQTVTINKPVIANFQQQGLLDHEFEAALEHFNFSGIPEGVNPMTRIAVFDTEAYVMTLPEEQREGMLVKIDNRLREQAERFPSEFIIVDPPYAPRPWPSYDEDTIEDILKLQERLNWSPESIRLYELENANRPEIVHTMMELEDPHYTAPEAEELEEHHVVEA